MRKLKWQSPKTPGKRVVFHTLFNTFRWLSENRECAHRVGWIGEYPLLTAASLREAFLTLQFLCNPTRKSNSDESITESIGKARSIAFTYLQTPFRSHDLRRQVQLQQREEIENLFEMQHGSRNVLVVRSDNLQSNGGNSIRECITNLIAAKFFISMGYMVLDDSGCGPDIIAFKIKLLKELRERRFIGRGASVSQLATIRTLGKVNMKYNEDIPKEEIIAVESESLSPQAGIEQLKDGYYGERFSYMGFFDRRVLAAPFLNERPMRLDVLTYDTNGLRYWKCDCDSVASDFWRSKKLGFINELHSSIKTMLLSNLTFDEIRSMISAKPLTFLCVLREAQKLKMEKILDDVEGVL